MVRKGEKKNSLSSTQINSLDMKLILLFIYSTLNEQLGQQVNEQLGQQSILHITKRGSGRQIER